MTLSAPPPHPVLWDIRVHGESFRRTALHQTAFGACAALGRLLSEVTVERVQMLEPSINPLRRPVPIKHRWRALGGAPDIADLRHRDRKTT